MKKYEVIKNTKRKLENDIAMLVHDKAIGFDDLADFSNELQEEVKWILHRE